MKICLLLIGIAIYSCILIYYFPNRDYIKARIHNYVPELFSPSNNYIVSVTRYHYKQSKSLESDRDPLPNTEFKYAPSSFFIDSTEDLKPLDLECLPDSFGYSIERGNEVFPPYEYPKCSEVNKQNDTYLHIDRDRNLLYMDCPKDSNNKYVVGPFDKRRLIHREEGYPNWKLASYKGPIDASEIEFGIGSCDKDGDELIQADMSPIFQPEAYEQAKNLTPDKPRIIFFLTLDSVSRRHFYRKIPKVVAYLNSLNFDQNSSYSAFDFNLHNTLGGDSAENHVPMLGGNLDYARETKGDQNKDFLGAKAMWNMFREKGYISLLAFESCDANFINALGRNPNVDYSVEPFNCAVERYTSTSFVLNSHVQRCIGGHQSHFYVLNYTLTTIEINPGVNHFIYLHIDTAHEGSGQHTATLNDDLEGYLKGFLERYKERYEVFIFLNADHGMRYGPWYTEMEGYMEQKLPALFIIASKSLLEKYPYSYDSLSTNTQRLISKMDLRETALYVAGFTEEARYSVNLLNKIAPKSRTCDDLKISPSACSCLKMTEISNPEPILAEMMERLKNYAESIINSYAYSDPKYPLGKICKKIELGRITKIYQITVNNVEEMYKLEIEAPVQKGMNFQVTFFLASDGKSMRANRDKFVLETFAYGRYPIKIRVRNMQTLVISRLDAFAGPCEKTARIAGVRPDFCACQ